MILKSSPGSTIPTLDSAHSPGNAHGCQSVSGWSMSSPHSRSGCPASRVITRSTPGKGKKDHPPAEWRCWLARERGRLWKAAIISRVAPAPFFHGVMGKVAISKKRSWSARRNSEGGWFLLQACRNMLTNYLQQGSQIHHRARVWVCQCLYIHEQSSTNYLIAVTRAIMTKRDRENEMQQRITFRRLPGHPVSGLLLSGGSTYAKEWKSITIATEGGYEP